jgi:hypothetical protein
MVLAIEVSENLFNGVTGGVCKGRGRNQREPMTRIPINHIYKMTQTFRKTPEWG